MTLTWILYNDAVCCIRWSKCFFKNDKLSVETCQECDLGFFWMVYVSICMQTNNCLLMAFKAYLNYDKKLFKKEVLISFGNGTVALPSSLLCTVFCLDSATSTFLIHTCNCLVHSDLASASLQLDLRCFCILL